MGCEYWYTNTFNDQCNDVDGLYVCHIFIYLIINLYTYIQLLFSISFQHSCYIADSIGGGGSGLGMGQGHASQEFVSI